MMINLLVLGYKRYKVQIINLLYKNLVLNKLYIYAYKHYKAFMNKDNNKLNLHMIVSHI
jgi:hypothetical protein